MARAPTKPYFAGLSKNTFLLALASLFSDIATEMLYPVLPVFMTETLKASGSILGLVDGVAQATQNIVQVFSGTLSDKLKRRKPIALAGYLIAALSKPLMGLSTVWQGLFAARLMDRFGTGTRSAPRDALIASSVEAADRGKAFGLEGFGDNIGAFLGPLLTVFLISVLGIAIRPIFYLALLPGLLAFFMVILVDETLAKAVVPSKINIRRQQFPRSYWNYLLVTAIFGLGNSSNAFLILRTQEMGASLRTTVLIYAVLNLVAALVSYPAGSISDTWSRKNVLLVAFVIFALVYLGFALTTNIVLLAGLFILYGLYQGIFRAVGKAFASDVVPEQIRASGIGWYSATVGLSQLAASIVAGLFWDRIGHAAVFYYGAGFAILGSVALCLLLPPGAGKELHLSASSLQQPSSQPE